ncbi:MAG: dihydroorotate dehydrogenase electron transfer subunit [Thermomicrobiales bacterium]|nr:dihydroorotate dehydrogenase electron transfer subunit [Thermomicrobiales bacterium]
MVAHEFVGTVVATEPIMGDATLLTFTCPTGLASAVRAGRFVEILCRDRFSLDPLLRRPFSLFGASTSDDTLTVLARPFGRASSWLVDRRVDDEVNLIGILGNAFTVAPKATNLLLVAGGVGAAPLVLLAEEAVKTGCDVTFLMGSPTAEGLLPPVSLPSRVEYLVATDDGSRGHHGFVTDLVPSFGQWADQVFACGPEPMYHSLKRVLQPYRLAGKPTVQVSSGRPMPCGFGACLGCIVETRRGPVASCLHGPVFDLDDLVW